MLNWFVWNRTVFDIDTVITLKLIVLNGTVKLNSLKWNFFWQLNCVLMLYWIAWNRTVFDIETILN